MGEVPAGPLAQGEVRTWGLVVGEVVLPVESEVGSGRSVKVGRWAAGACLHVEVSAQATGSLGPLWTKESVYGYFSL